MIISFIQVAFWYSSLCYGTSAIYITASDIGVSFCCLLRNLVPMLSAISFLFAYDCSYFPLTMQQIYFPETVARYQLWVIIESFGRTCTVIWDGRQVFSFPFPFFRWRNTIFFYETNGRSSAFQLSGKKHKLVNIVGW